MYKSIRIYITIIIFLCITIYALLYFIDHETRGGILTVSFLDVGQGDAIFIDSPRHGQILIDSGPSDIVLKELNKIMPWYDRTIDMIMITNPDKDHIAGFLYLLKRYKVKMVIMPDTVNSTDINVSLLASFVLNKLDIVIAKRGQVIDLGGGAYIVILFPDRNAGGLDSNTGSIIAKLIYKDFGVILTGDAPINTLNYVAHLDRDELKSDILKAGHHGSRTSAAEFFVENVKPDYAIVSASKNNSYGHPHKETVSLFLNKKIPILGTYDLGSIVVETNGEEMWFK